MLLEMAISRLLLLGPIVACILGAAEPNSFDFRIPVAGGSLLIRNASFIKEDPSGSDLAILSFKIRNETNRSWRSVVLRFDVNGHCASRQDYWHLDVSFGLGYSEATPVTRDHSEQFTRYVGKVSGCRADSMDVTLVEARTLEGRFFSDTRMHPVEIDFQAPEEMLHFAGTLCTDEIPNLRGTIVSHIGWNDAKLRISLANEDSRESVEFPVKHIDPDIPTLVSLDLASLLFKGFKNCRIGSAIIQFVSGESDGDRKARLEAKAAADEKEAAERAIEQERLAREAAERARRAVAARKKREADAEAKRRIEIAEEAARAAERHRRAQEFCSGVYARTANKKVADLTVTEEQAVRSCQSAGLYSGRPDYR